MRDECEPAVAGARRSDRQAKDRGARGTGAADQPGVQGGDGGEIFTEASAERLLAGNFDGVVDAVDLMSHKALIIAEAVKRRLKCVTVGGAGRRRDATQLRAGDLGQSGCDELLRQAAEKAAAGLPGSRVARATPMACAACGRRRSRCFRGPTARVGRRWSPDKFEVGLRRRDSAPRCG